MFHKQVFCRTPYAGFASGQRSCRRTQRTFSKNIFVEKKSSAAPKLTANNEQCTATRSSHFQQQYFIRRKNDFVPLFVIFAHVHEQCISGLTIKQPSQPSIYFFGRILFIFIFFVLFFINQSYENTSKKLAGFYLIFDK